MCNHKNRESAMAVLGEGVWCDPCLKPIIKALNGGGVNTIASCCGHGSHLSSIALADGRWMVLMSSAEWELFDSRRIGYEEQSHG